MILSKTLVRPVSLNADTPDDRAALQTAADLIRRGGLVVFPTETVYGLGANGLDENAARAIYAAKGRPQNNPLILHLSDASEIPLYCDVPEKTKPLLEKLTSLMPAPLTVILPAKPIVPHTITAGLPNVAVRVPTSKIARELIRLAGVPIAAPSANLSGKPSPTVAKYVVEDMMGRIDAIIDGGEVGIGLESTIIDLTVTPPQILRPGYITQEKLSEVLGTVDTDTTILRADSGQAPKAPGMKYRHYAPKGELTIVEGAPEEVREYMNRAAATDHAAGEKTGIIGTEEMLSGYTADVVKSVGSRKDEDSIARHLYTILREFDDEGVTKIYSEGFSTEGFGQAIMNRLLKAAGHKVVTL